MGVATTVPLSILYAAHPNLLTHRGASPRASTNRPVANVGTENNIAWDKAEQRRVDIEHQTFTPDQFFEELGVLILACLGLGLLFQLLLG
jgi:hypothetical protein